MTDVCVTEGLFVESGLNEILVIDYDRRESTWLLGDFSQAVDQVVDQSAGRRVRVEVTGQGMAFFDLLRARAAPDQRVERVRLVRA